MKGFLHYFTLRENCYVCRYSRVERYGDMTIADLWGLNRKQTPEYSPKYVSLVMVNTPFGEKLWNSIQDEIEAHQRPISEAVDGNDNLQHSTPYPDARNYFLKILQESNSFNYALKSTLKICFSSKSRRVKSFLQKLKGFARRIIYCIAGLFPPREEIAQKNSVGIVTIGREYLLLNYGSLMQHYALRKVLKDNNFSPWRCEGENCFPKIRISRFKRLIRAIILKDTVSSWLNKRFEHFLVKHYRKDW